MGRRTAHPISTLHRRPGRAGEAPANYHVFMPGTYSQILLHIVFSTQRREPWITAEVAPRLHAYLGGIVRAEKGVAFSIGVFSVSKSQEEIVTRYIAGQADQHRKEDFKLLC